MTNSTLTWLRAATFAALATHIIAQSAQCYYPNGVNAPSTEQPCSSEEGSACCPDTWECLDNGLCHLPSGNLYGVYSCTDKSWNSPGCASNICMYNNKRPGGESIKQCSNHNNEWCCNANDQDVKCCQESPSPRPFFQLQDGNAYATIGARQASTNPVISTITMLASGTAGGSSPSRTPQPSSSGAASSTNAAGSSPRESASPTPVVSVSRSVSSGPAGVVTYAVTVMVTPAASAGAGTGTGAGTSTSSSGGSNSNLGVIIGCAVGIPLALALVGILVWLLRKRRNQKKAGAYKETPEMEGSPSPAFAGGAGAKLGKDVYRHSRPGTSEIDGAPVGPARPVSNLPGRAELDSGAGFQPGHGPAYAPDTVGIGGGNGDGQPTWASAPPGYSPGMNQAAFAHPPNAMELADTSVMPVINEKDQQYQAYRPPPSEMPTVTTPPEDVEKQMQR